MRITISLKGIGLTAIPALAAANAFVKIPAHFLTAFSILVFIIKCTAA